MNRTALVTGASSGIGRATAAALVARGYRVLGTCRAPAKLTDRHEAELPEARGRWQVSDAPEGFIDGLLKAIVGIEVPVTRIEGKWKVSQNRSAEDRAGVAAGLAESADPRKQAMAALVRARGGE